MRKEVEKSEVVSRKRVRMLYRVYRRSFLHLRLRKERERSVRPSIRCYLARGESFSFIPSSVLASERERLSDSLAGKSKTVGRSIDRASERAIEIPTGAPRSVALATSVGSDFSNGRGAGERNGLA